MGKRKPKIAASELALLRHSAFTFFTLDTDCISIEQMAETPPYDQVGKTQLKKWADADEWLVARQKNLGRWRALVEEKLGQSLVEQKVRQLDQMRGMWEQGVHILNNTRLQANSWEGAMGAMTRLADVMDRWRDSLVGATLPIEGEHPGNQKQGGAGGLLPGGNTPLMTPQEARAAAHLILRQRKKDVLGGGDEEEAEYSESVAPQRAETLTPSAPQTDSEKKP